METYRYQAVEKHIMAMLDSGALSLGNKLPSLRSLSGKLGMSISTINQAYLELERKGVIESRPRSGFFVRQQSTRLHAPKQRRRHERATSGHPHRSYPNCGWNQWAARAWFPWPWSFPAGNCSPSRNWAALPPPWFATNRARAMDYAPIPGDPRLIRQIAYRSMEHGISVTPDDPIVTAGCMEALYISLRSVCRSGDTVLIQSPTYYCFLQLLENLGPARHRSPIRTRSGASHPMRSTAHCGHSTSPPVFWPPTSTTRIPA